MDEAMAHVPVLGHAHQGRIDGHLAMRMIAFHRLADDAGALARSRRGSEPKVMHGDEDAPLGRLQAVTHVGERPANDDAHGVREVAFLEFILNVERLVLVAVPVATRQAVRRKEFIRQGRSPRYSSEKGAEFPFGGDTIRPADALYLIKNSGLAP